jgi:hypothetical protein
MTAGKQAGGGQDEIAFVRKSLLVCLWISSASEWAYYLVTNLAQRNAQPFCTDLLQLPLRSCMTDADELALSTYTLKSM